MLRLARSPLSWTCAIVCMTGALNGQETLTWEEAKQKLQSSNPTLRAGRIEISQFRTQETTAFLRPNPEIGATIDQLNPFTGNPYQPFSNTLPLLSGSYLHEREHKRELRLQSAQGATTVAISQLADQERNLVFDLRGTFVEILEEGAIVTVARENLDYYDKLLELSRQRFSAGDISQVDLDRLELQRVQFESDLQAALVDLRNSKIQLLAMLNDHTPVDQLNVAGTFDFAEVATSLEDFRNLALQNRPDLRADMQAVEKAKTDYSLAVANGSTDPTFGWNLARDPPIPVFFGFSVTIPLRIFDRNQGEKARTQLDIERRRHLVEAARTQIVSDVDSAYSTLVSSLILLRPYRQRYLQQAARVRETISFSYQHGGASLIDFLQAQQDYRGIRLSFVKLIGSYLKAANQLNFAIGREVVQ